MGTTKTVSRPSALVRAEHGAALAHLTTTQRKVLEQALRRGEELREELETKTLEYGRWLLEEAFDDDTTAALDDKLKNPIWQELVRRAGGPTLGINQHLLYVALRIAAHDRRISSESWRLLDAGRKELLLPLDDESHALHAEASVQTWSSRSTTSFLFDWSRARIQWPTGEAKCNKGKDCLVH